MNEIETQKEQLLNEWYAQLSRNNSNNSSSFCIGDLVLAKWQQDDQYYLARIDDIEIKAKFGTQAKHYKISYLYDNVSDIVFESRLKTAALRDIHALLNALVNDERRWKRRKPPQFGVLSEDADVFYDEKTKNFTENCRLRRQRLRESESVAVKEDEEIPPPVERQSKKPVINKKRRLNNVYTETQPPETRHSSRKRKCCLRNSDYFYPENFDQIFKDKVNDSTLKGPEIIDKKTKLDTDKASVGQENENIIPNNEALSTNSPEEVSFASDLTPIKKTHPDTVEYVEEQPQKSPVNVSTALYSATEDGQYHCNSCHNKSFRKKQLVLDHIKHYHQAQQPNSAVTSTTSGHNNTRSSLLFDSSDSDDYNNQKLQTPSQTPKHNQSSQYVPRSINKVKKYIPNSSYSSRLNRSLYSEPYKRKSFKSPEKGPCTLSSSLSSASTTKKKPHGGGGVPSSSSKKQQQNKTGNTSQFQPSPYHIVYCNRCKKSTEEPHYDMLQCSVCLCWSHRSCYDIGPSISNSEPFWACDNCLGLPSVSSQSFSQLPQPSVSSERRQERYCRDKWRFGTAGATSVTAGPAPTQDYKNMCEVETILSVCNRVLDSILRNIEKLNIETNKAHNDSNSQDEFELLKNFSLDQVQINKLDHLLDHLPETTDDIFRDSQEGTLILPSSSSLPSVCKPTSCLQPTHSTARPQQNTDLDNALNNVSNQDLYLQFSADLPHLSNSTPTKLHTLPTILAASTNTQYSSPSKSLLLNNSLDNLLSECDINLDFLPNSEFDALVKDLRNCEEIVENSPKISHKLPLNGTATTSAASANKHTSNGAGHNTSFSQDDDDINVSRSTLLLDLFEEVEAEEKKRNSSASMVVSSLPISQQQQQQTVACSSNGGPIITSILSDPAAADTTINPLRTSSNKHAPGLTNENEILDFVIEKEESSGANLVPRFMPEQKKKEKSSIDISLTSSPKLESASLRRFKDNASLLSPIFHRATSSLQNITTSNMNSHSKSTNILPPLPTTSSPSSSSSTWHCYSQTPIENQLLKWLLFKYESVEKIINSVTKVVNISNSTRNLNDYKRIRHYLSSLLFVLQRNSE